MSVCPSSDQLERWLREEFSSTETSWVVAHLQDCPDCHRTLERLTDDPRFRGLAPGGTLGRPALFSIRHDCSGRRAGEGIAGIGSDESRANAAFSPVDPLDGESSVPGTVPPGRVGDCELLRVIGRGGMGVVYEALQGSLGRHVALKLLPEDGDMARFHREVRAAGRLHHTNIVPVFGAGVHDGRPYYLMQFIAGRGLNEVLKERVGRVEPDDREAARIGVQVAEALAYAHEQGVIHRDIKPSNLLLDDRGTVWISDFGLAYDADDGQSLTETGEFVGTLRYLAPERLAGRGDARADIYGLGVTLYEIACGRPAYEPTDRVSLIHRLIHEEPPRPRRVRPTIARDLETIILKAMERDPNQRYATAGAMAEDLRRFLEDRTIRARRSGAWERAWRWSRRNKVVSGLLAALILVSLGGFIGMTVLWVRADAEATRSNRLAKEQSDRRVAAQAEAAARDLDRTLRLADREDVNHGLLRMAEALAQMPAGRDDLARVVRTNLSAWGRLAPRRVAVMEHPARVYNARFRPDGRAILTHAEENVARLWDAATGRPLGPPLEHPVEVTCIGFSPDGRLAATGRADGSVRVWDGLTGRPTGPTPNREPLVAFRDSVAWVQFSADNRWLLCKDFRHRARLLDLRSGRAIPLPQAFETDRFDGLDQSEQERLFTDRNSNRVAAFSPDGRRLLLLDPVGRRARLLDLDSLAPVGPSLAVESPQWLSYSPGGRFIGTGSRGGTTRVWDAESGRAVLSLPPGVRGFDGASFSPDERRLLIFWSDHTAQLWDIDGGRPIGRPLRHGGEIRVGAFSPDGRLLLTAGEDCTARIWDASTGEPIAAPLRHKLPVWDASFSPDGRRILTAGLDGTAAIWELGPCDPAPIGERPVPPNPRLAGKTNDGPYARMLRALINRDGTSVLICGFHSARLIDVASGQPAGPLLWTGRGALPRAAAFGPDGRTFVVDGDTVVHYGVGEGGSGDPRRGLDGGLGPFRVIGELPIGFIEALAVGPDGRLLAVADGSGVVRVFDAVAGKEIDRPFAVGSKVAALAFSPDGRLLASGTDEVSGRVILWERGTGRSRGDSGKFQGAVPFLAFRPDGSGLVAGSTGGTTRIIETAAGGVQGEIRTDGRLNGLAIGPDGRRILTLCDGGGPAEARLWDAGTGEAVSPVMTHPGPSGLPPVFRPDGTAFAVAYADGTIRLWDVAATLPLGPIGTLRNECVAMAFRPDGRSMVAVERPGIVHVFPIPEPAVGTVDSLVREIRGRGNQGPVEAEHGDASRDPGSAEIWDRHERIARDAEADADAFGLRRHLDRMIAARPDDGRLYARRVRAHLWAGDSAAAEADLERAIALGPSDPVVDTLFQIAEDCWDEGRPADGARLLERVITARPSDLVLDYVFRRADESRREGRPDEALRLLSRVIAARPDDWRTYRAGSRTTAEVRRRHAAEAEGTPSIE